MHSCGWAHKCQVKLEKAIASSHSFEAVAHWRRTWEWRRRGTPAAAAHDTSLLLAWPLGVAPDGIPRSSGVEHWIERQRRERTTRVGGNLGWKGRNVFFFTEGSG